MGHLHVELGEDPGACRRVGYPARREFPLRRIPGCPAIADVSAGLAQRSRATLCLGRRIVKKLLFAALSVGLVSSQGTAGQSTRASIQGVWRIVEATITGPAARTIAFTERPNLTIITAKHYSRVEVQADGPRPILTDAAKATADELRTVWGPFVAEAGTYQVIEGSLITMRPIAS